MILTVEKHCQFVKFVIGLTTVKLGKDNCVFGVVLDVVQRSVNDYHLPQVSVQIPEILNKLSIFPHHRLSAQYPSDVHLFGVNLHDLIHDCILVLLGKYDNLVFLRQSSQHLLQTRTQSNFHALSEYVLTLHYGACEVEDESFGV